MARPLRCEDLLLRDSQLVVDPTPLSATRDGLIHVMFSTTGKRGSFRPSMRDACSRASTAALQDAFTLRDRPAGRRWCQCPEETTAPRREGARAVSRRRSRCPRICSRSAGPFDFVGHIAPNDTRRCLPFRVIATRGRLSHGPALPPARPLAL